MPTQQAEKRRTTQPKHEAKYTPPKRNTSTSYTGALTRLVYSYSSDAVQSATVAAKTWHDHNLHVPVVDDSPLDEVTATAPFVLKSRGATYYVRVLVQFEPNPNIGRFILACRRGTRDAEMPIFAVLQKTDTETNTAYLEMVMEDDFYFVKDDEMRLALRFFNESASPQTLNITYVAIAVAILQ